MSIDFGSAKVLREILKIRQAPLAILYKCSAIMTNFHVRLYKSIQTFDRFSSQPPSLDKFLNTQ